MTDWFRQNRFVSLFCFAEALPPSRRPAARRDAPRSAAAIFSGFVDLDD
jgi:hypothetical protein